jgi:hypothetical protein
VRRCSSALRVDTLRVDTLRVDTLRAGAFAAGALRGATGQAPACSAPASVTDSPSSAFSARSSDIARHVKLGVSRTV